MLKAEKCEACEGTGKDPAPPGIHKRCHYCRGTGWVDDRNSDNQKY